MRDSRLLSRAYLAVRVLLALWAASVGAEAVLYSSWWPLFGLMPVAVAVSGLLVSSRHARIASAPGRAAAGEAKRLPADSRSGLNASDAANKALLSACPVCGMEDGDRFRTGIGVAKWRGWPAHESCLAWLGEEPSDDPARVQQVWWPLGIPPARLAPARPQIPGFISGGYVPPAVAAFFPQARGDELAAVKLIQRHGHPVLAAKAKTGDTKILVYGTPTPSECVRMASPAGEVSVRERRSETPVDGGFWAIALGTALQYSYPAGTPVTPWNPALRPF